MLAAGQRAFGENRVQEAQGRWTPEHLGDAAVELRLIGPLQTNKAADALALFDVIETLDRPKLARALADAAAALPPPGPALFCISEAAAAPARARFSPVLTAVFPDEASLLARLGNAAAPG